MNQEQERPRGTRIAALAGISLIVLEGLCAASLASFSLLRNVMGETIWVVVIGSLTAMFGIVTGREIVLSLLQDRPAPETLPSRDVSGDDFTWEQHLEDEAA